MTIQEFCENYKAKRFLTTPSGINEKSEYLKKELEIKTYIPFTTKRHIAEMIVAQNIKEVGGIKKYNSIDGYVSLIVASIAAHTNLQFSPNPVADYDLLAESGLLTEIISQFKSSHDEIDIVLKMAREMALEDNNLNVLVGRFLDGVSKNLDAVVDGLMGTMDKIDLNKLLGSDFKPEDLAKLSGLLNKLK